VTFSDIWDEFRFDITQAHCQGFTITSLLRAYLGRVLRKSFSLLWPWFAIAASSLAMSGNPALVLVTVSLYLVASKVSIAPRNMVLHITLVALSTLAIMLSFPVAFVEALLVLSGLIALSMTPKSVPHSCSSKDLSPSLDLAWIALWIPQLAIGVTSYGFQQHQTFAVAFWVLARGGSQYEPWILGLTCLLLIIIGANKSPERRLNQ